MEVSIANSVMQNAVGAIVIGVGPATDDNDCQIFRQSTYKSPAISDEVKFRVGLRIQSAAAGS